MRRVSAIVAVVMLMGVIPASAGAANNNVKVDVCHAGGHGSYKLINLSENAVAKHLANHLDGLIGDPVPEMDGYLFGEACEFVEENTPPVAFDGTEYEGYLSDFAFDADGDELTFFIFDENPEGNVGWFLIETGGGDIEFSAFCIISESPTSSFKFYADDGQDVSNVATMTVPCLDGGGGSIL